MDTGVLEQLGDPARRSIHARARLSALLAAIGLALMTLAAPGGALAGEPVDGSTLTPPVDPGTPCAADGAWVRCDTSGVVTYGYEPAFDLPCGLMYETGVDDRHATRWYRDGLLVKRSVQASFRGSWSLSPTGDGPTVDVSGDWNWWIRFSVPGSDASGVLVSHGNALRVAGLEPQLRDVGIWLPDDTHHGLLTFDDASLELLCDRFVP
jgi:hypothetical protein